MMQISLIVPLHGDTGYARELHKYVYEYWKPHHVKEIIYVKSDVNNHLPELNSQGNIKTYTFAGATNCACLEAGAFEATGDVLFFVRPGTFPSPHYYKLIQECIQNYGPAGILIKGSSVVFWQRLQAILPLCCVLLFMDTDNFFITRHLFHLNSRHVPIYKSSSFSKTIHQYAIAFNAKLVV